MFTSFERYRSILLFLLLSFFGSTQAIAQSVVHSTTGYQVNISIVPIALVIHTNPCTWATIMMWS